VLLMAAQTTRATGSGPSRHSPRWENVEQRVHAPDVVEEQER